MEHCKPNAHVYKQRTPADRPDRQPCGNLSFNLHAGACCCTPNIPFEVVLKSTFNLQQNKMDTLILCTSHLTPAKRKNAKEIGRCAYYDNKQHKKSVLSKSHLAKNRPHYWFTDGAYVRTLCRQSLIRRPLRAFRLPRARTHCCCASTWP